MNETTLKPTRIERQDIVYEDAHQKIQRVLARFDGFDKEYMVMDYGRRAAVVAVRNGQVLFTRQYRLLINDVSLEVPGGRVDEQEDPDAAAARECREETGVACKNLKPLINYYLGLDALDNFTYVFYSDDVTDTGEGEPDRKVWLPLTACLQMVFDGQIQDSLTVIALLAYRHRTCAQKPFTARKRKKYKRPS